MPLLLKVGLLILELFTLKFTWLLMSSYDHERTPQSLGTGVRKKLAFWAILVSICCFLISIYYRKIENDETAKNFFIVSIGCVFVFSSEFFLILKAFPKNTIIDKKIKEGKKRLAELEAEEIIEPKIYDDAAENNYAEGKLGKDDNVEQEPNVENIERQAENEGEVEIIKTNSNSTDYVQKITLDSISEEKQKALEFYTKFKNEKLTIDEKIEIGKKRLEYLKKKRDSF